MLFSLFCLVALVFLSVSASAFEINDSGADFSVEGQFSTNIYFENPGGQKIRIQSNNNFGYFNRFVKLDEKITKWDLVFNRAGRADILKIVVVVPNARINRNTVVVNDFLIGFDDAIAQGFNVELRSVENDVEVYISNFSEIFGTITIDPTIIDTTALSLTNYGNTLVRDSSGNIFTVQEVVTDSGSNTDIFVAKSTDDGVSFTSFNLTNSNDTNESLPHIDINSTDGLMIEFDGNDSQDIFVTTCSTGGCDSNSEFLDKLNVSDCGDTIACANGNIVHDQNGTSHISYARDQSSLRYRSNTGFVGASWGAEETVGSVGGGAILGRDGTGILIANNGDGTKIVFTNANGAQANIGFFNGTLWSPSVLELETTGIQEALSGFAGYDGNFYLAYAKDVSGTDISGQIHYRQCTNDCNLLASWSTDINVTNGGLNLSWVSLFQSSDLNVNIIASSLVSAADANLFLFVRTPNNIFTTSNIADANLLFSDANRTYNPLIRNRDYDGQVLPLGSLPTTGLSEIDYVFLTSDNSNGDPNTLLFDSNTYVLGNGIITSFTTKPASPIALDPEQGITNVLADFNSTTQFFPATGLLDINYLWQVDGEEISTDQNTVWDFNVNNSDTNVSFITQANDGLDTFISQQDQNILLRTNAQNLDINFLFNPESTLADVNFGVTAGGITTTINFAVWGFPNDNNLGGLMVNQQYRVGDNRQVCVVVNTNPDLNKLKCENFLTTRVIAKIPLDVTSSAELTPFAVSINSVPAQSFTSVSADQNFWFFSQGADLNTFNMVTDANVDFQVSNNLILLNSVDLNQTIQPYMSAVADGGISVIFTAKDSVTDDIIPNLIIFFSRTVTAVGNTLVQSGVTDSFGRLSLSFIPNIDHNFTAEFPIGTIIKTGVYVPETIDATNGVQLLSPSGAVITDANTVGSIDVNFLQVNARVKSDGTVDLNQTVTTDRDISSITITIDHNSVNLFTDLNSVGVSNGGIFSQSIDVNGLSRLIPLIVTVDGNFTDGNTFTSSRGITIVDGDGLVETLEAAREELGDTPGTMVLLAFIVATLLGFYHFTYPSPTGDTSSSFILVAVIFSLATVVGWIDGVSWIFATLASGAVYFLQRVNK